MEVLTILNKENDRHKTQNLGIILILSSVKENDNVCFKNYMNDLVDTEQ